MQRHFVETRSDKFDSVVLDKNKPKIQTVVNKIDVIQNDYRTMQLEVLAGNHSLVTTVVENGLRFHVDLATVYWNSRLATERQRLLNCFSPDDVVCKLICGPPFVACIEAYGCKSKAVVSLLVKVEKHTKIVSTRVGESRAAFLCQMTFLVVP